MSNNPGTGRFLSVDPLAPDYPELTPYQFASNRPIDGIDLDGLEYDDSKLKILKESETNHIKITGQIDVKIKVINLSTSKIKEGILSFHEFKSSRAFDIDYRSTSTNVPLDPATGKPLGIDTRVYVNDLDINFHFISVDDNLSNLKNGDVTLILTDNIPPSRKGDPGGISQYAGNVYAIEIDEFNKKSHIDTHERASYRRYGRLEKGTRSYKRIFNVLC